MSMRMRTSVSFTTCPECNTPIGSQGLPRHRKAQHGVEVPRQTKPKRPKRLTLAERLAQIEGI